MVAKTIEAAEKRSIWVNVSDAKVMLDSSSPANDVCVDLTHDQAYELVDFITENLKRPEPPKPEWHDAKAAELWVLTLNGWNEQPALVGNDGEFILRDTLVVSEVPRTLKLDSDRITDARKVYPEGKRG